MIPLSHTNYFISCDYTHTHMQTHSHAVRRAFDLSVLTEAQEVTIRLQRNREKNELGVRWHAWACVTTLDIDIVVSDVVSCLMA